MPQFLPANTANLVAESCQAGHAKVGEALATLLGTEVTAAVSEPAEFAAASAGEPWDTPGLVIEFAVDGGTVTATLPTAAEAFPAWTKPGEGGDQEQTSALAQQLAAALLPADHVPETAAGRVVASLRDELAAICPNEIATRLAVPIQWGDESCELSIFWEVAPPETAGTAPASTDPTPAAGPSPRRTIQYADLDDGLRQLPPFARSLLRIRVPVSVTLAETKIPVSRVLDIGPGSILQFNKSCESPLSLEAGDQEIATGEAVRVGDKFGLWITAIAMPDERFWVLQGNRASRVK